MEITTPNNQQDEIVVRALERFKQVAETESELRRLSLEDQKFAAGDQWPDEIKRDRDRDHRPCLTVNRLPQHIRQVTNDQRQNRPAIKVSPVDDVNDPELADVYQGLIRHIEQDSDADAAYDTAFSGAVRGGFGFFRIITKYCDPMSFDLKLWIKRCKNPHKVFIDPFYSQSDASDCMWGGEWEDLSREDYEKRYPNSELASLDAKATIGDHPPEWVKENGIRVADYYEKVYETREIVLLSTGEVLFKDEMPEVLDAGVQVEDERKTQVPKVYHYIINAVEVLEKTEFPAPWIPIIPVFGEELDIDGVRILESLVRHAKDPQRMLNYWESAKTESIALAPKAPWVGPAGSFEGFESEWQQANTKNFPYLEYNPQTVDGRVAPPPQRQVYEPPVQAITQATVQSGEDIKNTTGIYDASLGNRSNENSGVAIQRRNLQAQTSNFHFSDNLARALRHAGRILIYAIPKIYDTERVVRIIGEDGEERTVWLNKEFEENGKKKNYQMNHGKFDVRVSTGPSYATKRQEAVDTILEFMRVYPQAASVIGDLLAKNMDWPGADEIAERLRRTIAPEILGDEGGEEIPPAVQQKMVQMNQMIEQLTQALQQANEDARTKRVELESKERIEAAKIHLQKEKLQVDLVKKAMEIDSVEGLEAFKAEVAEIERQQNMQSTVARPSDQSQQYTSPSLNAPGANVGV